ncbi:MAG: imidazole glycerol phosphate synthase subunit HisH, partial [Actinomycetia bacterium]|nr:imidazole glycerol phosphate synthase subunit HisH [Actinomycetes bacterium]
KLPEGVKVPHMGWNSLKKKDNKNILLKDVKDGDYFYFVHSYYAVPDRKDVIVGKTDYGIDFASVICQENLMAVQFHPEKSSDRGLAILNNFGGICK